MTTQKLLIIRKEHSGIDNFARLAAKPGVQSTLILSKTDGTIIRSTGLPFRTTSSSPKASGSTEAGTGLGGVLDAKTRYMGGKDDVGTFAEDIAMKVFSFVSAAGMLASSIEEGDDVQLVRLRTKKHEIVIALGMLIIFVYHFPHELRILKVSIQI